NARRRCRERRSPRMATSRAHSRARRWSSLPPRPPTPGPGTDREQGAEASPPWRARRAAPEQPLRDASRTRRSGQRQDRERKQDIPSTRARASQRGYGPTTTHAAHATPRSRTASCERMNRRRRTRRISSLRPTCDSALRPRSPRPCAPSLHRHAPPPTQKGASPMTAWPENDEVSMPLASVRAPAVVTAANLSKRYGQGDAEVEAL